jgi:hypothetical protein
MAILLLSAFELEPSCCCWPMAGGRWMIPSLEMMALLTLPMGGSRASCGSAIVLVENEHDAGEGGQARVLKCDRPTTDHLATEQARAQGLASIEMECDRRRVTAN